MKWSPKTSGVYRPTLRYVLIAEAIRTAIEDGRYPPGSALPHQHLLARSFDVSLSTLQLALDLLGSEGLIVRTRGKGTFVATVPPKWLLIVHNDQNVGELIRSQLSSPLVGVLYAEDREQAVQISRGKQLIGIMIQMNLRSAIAIDLAESLPALGVAAPIIYLVSREAGGEELALVRRAIAKGQTLFMSDDPSRIDIERILASLTPPQPH